MIEVSDHPRPCFGQISDKCRTVRFGQVSDKPLRRSAFPESTPSGFPPLYYKVLKPLDRSWKIFIHMDGPMRVNGDHDPLGGRCPTTTWKPGDVIIDRTPLRVDPTLNSGKYMVWIGFFGGVAPNWRNLSLSDAPSAMRDEHQRFRLTSIEITK